MDMAWSPMHPARRRRVLPWRRRLGLIRASPLKGTAVIRRTGLQAAVQDQVTKARGRGAEPRLVRRVAPLAAARAAAEGIAALQKGTLSVFALQALHAERVSVALV